MLTLVTYSSEKRKRPGTNGWQPVQLRSRKLLPRPEFDFWLNNRLDQAPIWTKKMRSNQFNLYTHLPSHQIQLSFDFNRNVQDHVVVLFTTLSFRVGAVRTHFDLNELSGDINIRGASHLEAKGCALIRWKWISDVTNKHVTFAARFRTAVFYRWANDGMLKIGGHLETI